jgi:hypothetical protein
LTIVFTYHKLKHLHWGHLVLLKKNTLSHLILYSFIINILI